MTKLVTALLCLSLFVAGRLAPSAARDAPRGKAKKAVMTNATLIKRTRRGVGESAIIAEMRRSTPRFDTSAKGLRSLRKAKVGEAVIAEAVESQRPQRVESAPGAQGNAAPPSAAAQGDARDDDASFDRLPPSRFYDHIAVDESVTFRLPPPPASNTSNQQGGNRMLIVGVVRPLPRPLNTAADGRSFDLGHGTDEIMAVVSEGARQVRVRFASVAIPRGGKLFVYSLRDRNEVYGPYEGGGPSGEDTFWSPPVEGEGLVVEYYRPRPATGPARGPGPFQIVEVSHIY